MRVTAVFALYTEYQGSAVPPDGGASAMMGGGGGGVGCDGLKTYTATRFEYAKNGETVTYAMGEQWCSTGIPGTCPSNPVNLWAREFRYDGAQARYMNRPLNPVTFAPFNPDTTVWSDYDGDETYGDFTVASASPWTVTEGDKYEPGLWRSVAGAADYLHNDMLGTLRQLTDSAGAPVTGSAGAYTAFGEQVAGAADRFGYVGSWGYQNTLDSGGAEVFPYLHVGARYYDPSLGRFLQRDPIGIVGGTDVYAYANGQAAGSLDPMGLDAIDVIISLDPVINDVINGWIGGTAGSTATVGATANYKWRLGLGRLFNRSAAVCAGSFLGWNVGRLLGKLGVTNALGNVLAPIVVPGDGPGTPTPPPPPRMSAPPPMTQVLGGLLG